MPAAASKLIEQLAVVAFRVPWWLWLPGLAGLLFASMFLASELSERLSPVVGYAVLAIAVITFVVLILWRHALDMREIDRLLAIDKEAAFVWTHESSGSLHVWRFKAATDPLVAVRKVRVEVIQFAAMTALVVVSVAGVFTLILIGGLRVDDLSTFLPIAAVVLLMCAALVKWTWRAAFGLTPIEIRYDQAHQLIEVVGVLPLKGVAKRTIRVGEIASLSARESTFKGMTFIRVSLNLVSGTDQLLFANLSQEEWDRISPRLPNACG